MSVQASRQACPSKPVAAARRDGAAQGRLLVGEPGQRVLVVPQRLRAEPGIAGSSSIGSSRNALSSRSARWAVCR